MEDNVQNNSRNDNKSNPMKEVKTAPLPTKHEFSSNNSHKNSEKEDDNN